MRMRNVKNKEEILNASKHLIINPKDYYGKWKNLFNNNNPIHVEIGTGKGNFIINKAIKYPNINFIGIEKFDSIIARCVQKIPDDLTNLKIVRMNALEIDLVFKKEIETLYLNFSDPWPKKRWYKRRLTSEVFLEKYDKIFKKNPIIIQKTDNRDLFEYSLLSYSNNGYILKDISLDLHNSSITDNIMTEYEERFVSKGNQIYYVVAEKEKKK